MNDSQGATIISFRFKLITLGVYALVTQGLLPYALERDNLHFVSRWRLFPYVPERYTYEVSCGDHSKNLLRKLFVQKGEKPGYFITPIASLDPRLKASFKNDKLKKLSGCKNPTISQFRGSPYQHYYGGHHGE